MQLPSPVGVLPDGGRAGDGGRPGDFATAVLTGRPPLLAEMVYDDRAPRLQRAARLHVEPSEVWQPGRNWRPAAPAKIPGRRL